MAWWKYAKPGDKVVCVDRGRWVNKPKWWEFWKNRTPPAKPVENEVYTISAIYVCDQVECGVAFTLVGFPSDDGKAASMFRPVQENKKSTEAGMQALRRHLTGKTVEMV